MSAITAGSGEELVWWRKVSPARGASVHESTNAKARNRRKGSHRSFPLCDDEG